MKGRRRPLGQPFRFASPPLPPLLDSASAPPASDDMSFLEPGRQPELLTEWSVSSIKSYPHNLWATPSHSDYPITSEKMAIRSYLRRSHRSQVKKRRRRLALCGNHIFKGAIDARLRLLMAWRLTHELCSELTA